MSRRTPWPALAACAWLAGCGGGGIGDPPSEPPANPYGTGQLLSELAGRQLMEPSTGEPIPHVLGPADMWLDPADEESAGCSVPLDEQLRVTGLTLTAVDEYDETGSGATGNHYVQDTLDTMPPYSGITVFDPGFSPPSLRVAPGDVVDILGFVTEFLGPGIGSRFGFCRTLPEISGSMELRFEGQGLEPKVIGVEELASYERGRKWLGMLVRLENVTMLENPYDPGNGRYSIRFDTGDPGLMGSDIPTISNELYDMKTEGPALSQGQTVRSVTGIVTFFYGFHIAPRSAADIVP